MGKRSSWKPSVTERRAAPIVGKGEGGRPVLLCPFCNPSHPVLPGRQYPCGTRLDVVAVQVVVRSTSTDRHVRCVKCGKSGGKMVPYGDAYQHVEDCTPGVLVLQDVHTSKFAEFVYTLPEPLRKLFSGLGSPQPIQEVEADGTRTGKVRGYVFLKG